MLTDLSNLLVKRQKKQTTKFRLQSFEKLSIYEVHYVEKSKTTGQNTVDLDETAHYEPSDLDL